MEAQERINTHPEIKFYYSSHKLENVAKFIESAKNYDIIFLEGVGEDAQYRRDLENSINNTAGLPESPAKNLAMEDIALRTGDSMFGRIVQWAIRTNKEVHMIDASSDHAEIMALKEAQTVSRKSEILFAELKPIESFETFEDYVSKVIGSTHQRDALVQRQILRLLEHGKNLWKGKKIIVFQGSGHRGTYRQFKRQNPEISSSRIFGTGKSTFELVDEIITRESIGKLSDIDIKRYFLYVFVIHPNNSDSNELSKRIARSSDEASVTAAFDELKKIEDVCNGMNDKEFAKIYFKKHIENLADILKQNFFAK